MSVATDRRASEQQNSGASYAAVPTSTTWPRTDPACLPSCLRILADTDQDGAADHVVSVKVRIADDNGNGRFDLGVDRIVLTPCALELIDPDVPLGFSPADWRGVVRRAIEQL